MMFARLSNARAPRETVWKLMRQSDRWQHAWRWGLWILAAGVAAAVLRHYRVDNRLSDWLPAYESVGPAQSYVVAGYARGMLPDHRLADAVGRLPSVAFVIDPRNVSSASWLTGADAADFVVSRDGTYEGLFAFRRSDTSDERFAADVRACVEQVEASARVPPHTVALGGPRCFSRRSTTPVNSSCDHHRGIVVLARPC